MCNCTKLVDGVEMSDCSDIDLHRYRCNICGEVNYYSHRAREHYEGVADHSDTIFPPTPSQMFSEDGQREKLEKINACELFTLGWKAASLRYRFLIDLKVECVIVYCNRTTSTPPS